MARPCVVFDNFRDRAAAQVLRAFATDTALVLAHIDICREIKRDSGGAEIACRTWAGRRGNRYD
jgi:hypothetical protein